MRECVYDVYACVYDVYDRVSSASIHIVQNMLPTQYQYALIKVYTRHTFLIYYIYMYTTHYRYAIHIKVVY